jgi:uncharacterized membrane protein YeaQ/YmgE (transglycosylase-associated protein family)
LGQRGVDVVWGKQGRGDIMSAATLLVILVVGLIAGWLAGQVVKGTGFSLVADIAIGIVGALIGSWLLPRLGIHLGSGIVPAIIGATIGAIILLLILRLNQIKCASHATTRRLKEISSLRDHADHCLVFPNANKSRHFR